MRQYYFYYYFYDLIIAEYRNFFLFLFVGVKTVIIYLRTIKNS